MSDPADLQKLAAALMGAPMSVAPLFGASNPQMPTVYSPTGTLAPGQTEMGNINLMDRPNVPNPSGGWSSVRSMNTNVNGQEVLMPTVSQTALIEPDQAVDNYIATGQHLGKFANSDAAEAYARALHDQQAAAGVARAPAPYTFGSIFSGWDKR